jgi:gamma-glutamylputrescine oxidase
VVGFGGHGVAPTTMGGELVAAAIADGDERYKAFAQWPLRWAGGPVFGRAAAQSTYWWYEFRDWFKEWREG